ncbi:hypothetical protein [Streptomyces mirabilis]|uniref:hypothetical protein n=1 Tax=Streptomyces mirabilis TaxID=68239 RepID=UPI003248838E
MRLLSLLPGRTAERRIMRSPALSIASQAVGALQLAMILWRSEGGSNTTDTCFYLFSLGLLPSQILTVGVMYPLMINRQASIGRKAAQRLASIVPVLAVLVTATGVVWLATAGRVTADLVPLLALSAFNSALQSMIWSRGVAAESTGEPHWFAAVALPANTLAVIALLVPWRNENLALTAMLAALVVGNAGYLGFMVRQRIGSDAVSRLPEQSMGSQAAWWYLARAGTGYGGLAVLSSLAVLLPPSALTVLAVVTKLVGSVASAFVNAVLPALVHADTDSPFEAHRFMRLTGAVLLVLGFSGVVVTTFLPGNQPLLSVTVATWLVAAATAAAAQRVAFRFLAAKSSIVTLLVLPIVLLASVATAAEGELNLTNLLAAQALVDAATAAFLLAALRDKAMAIGARTATAMLVAIWIASTVST